MSGATFQGGMGRLGCVPYLNARPLIRGLDGVELAVPSELAERFSGGEFAAALLPVFAALERDDAAVVDGVAIACDGAVFSVFLAYQGDLELVRSVALDTASRTSVNLLRCVLAEFYGWSGEFTTGPAGAGQARLMIGDPAIAFRRAAERPGGEEWQFLDLGAEWKRWTGLPFVFACWVLREGVENPYSLAKRLRAAKVAGLAARDEIAGAEVDGDFARRYLGELIRYDLGSAEQRGLRRFRELCERHGLLAAGGGRLTFY